jgi:hypothetical protein
MRLSSIALVAGTFFIGAVSVAPCFAGTPASISGSATFITPAGFTSTVSAETVLSSGLYFPTLDTTLNAASLPGATTVTKASLSSDGPLATTGSPVGGAVIVLPQFTLQGFSIAVESLSIGSGAAASAVSPISGFNLAAATVLTNSAGATANSATVATEGRTLDVPDFGIVYASANIDFISAIIKSGAGVNGLD